MKEAAHSMDESASAEYLETYVDKFHFRVRRGYLYTSEDLWVSLEGGLARVGLTDFLQQKSGDMAFVKPAATGKEVRKGDAIGEVETMKTTLEITSPLDGVVVEANDLLDERPELVNEDPYGEGWLVAMRPAGGEAIQGLLDAHAYFELMKEKLAEEERGRKSRGGGNG